MTLRKNRGPGPLPAEQEAALFPPLSRWSEKVRCAVCGSIGYPGGMPWQQPHRRGHSPCPDCGRQLTLRIDGTPRRHAQCPGKEPS